MALFSSTQPSIRARILPRFPAQVLAGSGMIITRENGKYIFSAAPASDMTQGRLLGRDTLVGDPLFGPPVEISVTGGLTFTGANGIQLSNNQRKRGVAVYFTNPAAGHFRDVASPLSCTISSVTMLSQSYAAATTPLVVDIFKATYATWEASLTTGSIIGVGGTKPTIAVGSEGKYQDATLTNWDQNIAAGDILRFQIVSAEGGTTHLNVFLDVVTI